MKRRIGLELVGAAVALVMAAVGAVTVLAAQGVRGVCASEDSVSCVWIGPVQGNGRGRVVVNGPAGR